MKRVLYVTAIFVLVLAAQVKPSEVGAQTAAARVMKASSIQVLMIQSDEVKLPAEFQIALYENLIQQLEKNGGFQHVYREGDHNADSVADLVVLHSTVRGFKKGSEMARNVTTVAGKTEIDVHCEFTDKGGKSVLEKDLNGKVRFFGGNLRATLDFAKKGAKIAHDNFAMNPAS
jgi:hypothetical protein